WIHYKWRKLQAARSLRTRISGCVLNWHNLRTIPGAAAWFVVRPRSPCWWPNREVSLDDSFERPGQNAAAGDSYGTGTWFHIWSTCVRCHASVANSVCYAACMPDCFRRPLGHWQERDRTTNADIFRLPLPAARAIVGGRSHPAFLGHFSSL